MSIAELRARVAEATGADRELDCLLFEYERPELKLSPAMRGSYYGEATGEYFAEGQRICVAPAYTASLDATLALVEQKLPGWLYGFMLQPDGFWAGVAKRPDDPLTEPDVISASGNTAPLAILSALLSALDGRAV